MASPLLPVAPDGHDRPDAVTVAGRSLSDSGLDRAARAVAARISGASVVAVDATPTLETVVAVLGGLLAGVPVVPVPADAGPAEREHILRDSAADLLLATGGRSGEGTGSGSGAAPYAGVGTAARAPSAWLPVVPVDVAAADTGWSAAEPDPAAAALILYTSGTTGAPKGVVVSRGAIAADLDALADAWAWTPDDVVVHGLPLFHVHGLVLGVLGARRARSRLVHTGRPSPAAYAEAAGSGGSLYFGVPTVWSRIAADAAAAAALRSARLLVSGSAALPGPVAAALAAACGQAPAERYGMTETLITVATRADGPRPVGTVGVPLVGVGTRIVDDDGRPLPADGEAVGSLQVKGPMVMDRYLGRPEETVAAFDPDGWFRTGDAATIGPDGVHRIVGRESTDLIKTGGYRVGSGEVEGALLAHPAVSEAAVVGVPDDDLGQVIVAFVVVTAPVAGSALVSWVADGLSVHKRPRRVVLVDSLPRNAMGKVQKGRLLEP